MAPAWFKGNLRQNVRGQGRGLPVAVVGEKRQQVHTCRGVLAGVQSHDIRRHESRRVRTFWILNCKSRPYLVVEILGYPNGLLPRPGETDGVVAVLTNWSQFLQGCNAVAIGREKGPHLADRE